MAKLFVILLTASFIAFIYYMQVDYEDAMVQCQVEHSFDTCFHSLNR